MQYYTKHMYFTLWLRAMNKTIFAARISTPLGLKQVQEKPSILQYTLTLSSIKICIFDLL